jgi:iron-sulfur cluster repair protein YtfE (RIC family)
MRSLASLARVPLPQLRRALARRQRAELRTRLAALQQLARQALAGPLVRVPAGRELRAALTAFRRGLTAHLRAESRVLRGRGAWSTPRRRTQAERCRELERRVREHQQSEERIDALRAAVARARDLPAAPAVLRRLQTAVTRMETALHEQICAENQVLFRRLRSLR